MTAAFLRSVSTVCFSALSKIDWKVDISKDLNMRRHSNVLEIDASSFTLKHSFIRCDTHGSLNEYTLFRLRYVNLQHRSPRRD